MATSNLLDQPATPSKQFQVFSSEGVQEPQAPVKKKFKREWTLQHTPRKLFENEETYSQNKNILDILHQNPQKFTSKDEQSQRLNEQLVTYLQTGNKSPDYNENIPLKYIDDDHEKNTVYLKQEKLESVQLDDYRFSIQSPIKPKVKSIKQQQESLNENQKINSSCKDNQQIDYNQDVTGNSIQRFETPQSQKKRLLDSVYSKEGMLGQSQQQQLIQDIHFSTTKEKPSSQGKIFQQSNSLDSPLQRANAQQKQSGIERPIFKFSAKQKLFNDDGLSQEQKRQVIQQDQQQQQQVTGKNTNSNNKKQFQIVQNTQQGNQQEGQTDQGHFEIVQSQSKLDAQHAYSDIQEPLEKSCYKIDKIEEEFKLARAQALRLDYNHDIQQNKLNDISQSKSSSQYMDSTCYQN